MAEWQFGMTLWVLERCKACGGTGRLGTAGTYIIFCECCEGSCLTWVERCYFGNYQEE